MCAAMKDSLRIVTENTVYLWSKDNAPIQLSYPNMQRCMIHTTSNMTTSH